MAHQNLYFKASWIKRGLVLVAVICPNVLGVFPDVAGLPNCGWLNRLKNSVRNCSARVSVSFVVLMRDASQLNWPGPSRMPN